VTTIAYRDGVLAGDTRVVSEDTVLPVRERKIFRLPDGSLIAAAGDAEQGELLLRAMRKGYPPPRLSGDAEVEAILIKPGGALFFYESNLWLRQRALFYAIGTGRSYALGALAQGASAIEAVRIGIRFNAHSGGRVQSLRLDQRRRRHGH
jgi:ATP-dependent protease HslVU (ClpYQ) peptidase subunit